MESFDKDRVYYVDETCHVCGVECGSRLCESCREDTEWQFRDAMAQFTKEQIRHLANLLDGVYLETFLRRRQ